MNSPERALTSHQRPERAYVRAQGLHIVRSFLNSNLVVTDESFVELCPKVPTKSHEKFTRYRQA